MPVSVFRLSGLCLAALAASSCAGLPGVPAQAPHVLKAAANADGAPVRPAVGMAASAPAGTPAAPAGGPPPFATVIKDARRIEAPLVAWQKDEKLWLELKPEQLGQPFLLTPKIRSGIGEGLLLGGLATFSQQGAGGSQVVEFVRVHNTIRLQARNTDVSARDGTPEARALASSYSASLLGATAVASQPHPERKSFLIEANGLFLSDIAGIGMHLQRMYRQGHSMDPRNSLITAVRGLPQGLVIETQSHYYTGSISAPQPGAGPGGSSGLPGFVPDSRSLLIGQHFALVPLPAQPMPARRADPRVGLFTTTVFDFSDDLARTPRRRMVTRWRLEKKDPQAEVSEPVRPIRFLVDRNVPLAYRDVVRGAILEWNKAFERIGIRGAIVVEQQADAAAGDSLDPGAASVRWMMSAEPSFGAIGQTVIDPRSGEIVGAAIGFEAMTLRAQRYARTQLLSGALDGAVTAPLAFAAPPAALRDFCRHGDAAAEQASYALDVLAARGEIDPSSPAAQQFVLDYVKDTVMHEVGHALGLRHNFRASRAYTEAQLSDPDFTREHGTTASVMEYNAVNLARPGERGGAPFQTTLGPYDYWAIEYAYRPLPAADEEAGLQRIAARSHEPLLAFGTDEDAAYGLDAETIQLDLGADPVAFAAKRLDIARDLFRRQETRELSPDSDYSVLRRSLAYALGDAARAVGVLARQLGGLRTLRDFPGSGREPLEPVPADVQRQAFGLMADALLAPHGLEVSPALQRRLAPDYLDRSEMPGLATDFNVPQRLLDLQRSLLAHLLGEGLAARMLDAQAKLDPGASAFELGEIYARLARDLWSELGSSAIVVAPPRRELQRDYVNRVAAALLRPAPGARADARGALRREAQALLARLDRALRRKDLAESTRDHLADSADSLRQALEARLPRFGV